MKLKITIVVEHEVKPENLKQYYEANTIQEAAVNQQKWLDEGACGLADLINDSAVVIIEGIK